MSKTIKKNHYRIKRDDAELTLLAIPTLVWFVLFSYLPMIGILIAFKDFRIFAGENFLTSLFKSQWVGLTNFEFLFRTPDAFVIIRNTLLYNITFIVLNIVVPVIFAIALTQLHSQKLAKFSQTAMFLPFFLSWVVVGYFVYSFLSYDKGLANQLLVSFGSGPVQWYLDDKKARNPN